MTTVKPVVRPCVYSPVYDVTSYGGASGYNAAIGRWQPDTVEPIAQATPTLYVDSSATGAGDGSSWTNAYTTIMAAYTAASNNDVISISGGASGKTYTENLSPLNKAITVTIQGSTDNGHDGLVYVNGGLLVNNASSVHTFNNFKIGITNYGNRCLWLNNGDTVHNNMQYGVNTSTSDNNLAVRDSHVFNYCTFSESGYKTTNGGLNLFSLSAAIDLEFNYCTFQVSGNIVTLPAASTLTVNNCTALPFHEYYSLFWVGNNADSTVTINRSAFFGVHPVNSGANSVINVDQCYWTKQPGVTGVSSNSPYFDSSNVATITNSISNVNPKYRNPKDTTIGQFFVRYDDLANLGTSITTAETLNPEIVITHAVNLHGMNFSSRPSAGDIDNMRTLIANGNEIMNHSADHADSDDLGTINISATGTSPTLDIVATQTGDSTTWSNTLTITINSVSQDYDLTTSSYDTIGDLITALNGASIGNGTVTCTKSNSNNSDYTFSAMLDAVASQSISSNYEMSFDRTAFNRYEITESIADLEAYINSAEDRNGSNAVSGTTVAAPSPAYVCRGYASPYGLGDSSIVTLLQNDSDIWHGNQAGGTTNESTYYDYGSSQNMYNNKYTNHETSTGSEDLFSMAASASGGSFVYFPLFHSETPTYNGSLANFKTMLIALRVGGQTMSEYFEYIRTDGAWTISEPNAAFIDDTDDYLSQGDYRLNNSSPLLYND